MSAWSFVFAVRLPCLRSCATRCDLSWLSHTLRLGKGLKNAERWLITEDV